MGNAAKLFVLRGSMAGIAGAKVISSIKSFLRPASSGESLEEFGWTRSPGERPLSMTKLEARPNRSLTKQWITSSLIQRNSTWRNSKRPWATWTSGLADALAELRQQKAATEGNKPKGDIPGDAESWAARSYLIEFDSPHPRVPQYIARSRGISDLARWNWRYLASLQ